MTESELSVISVCDIRIGELFKVNPDLEGKYIDINTLAIGAIIKSINPNATGTVVFNAVHDDTINKNVRFPTKHGLTSRKPFPRLQRDASTKVSVAIGGSQLSLPDDTESFSVAYWNSEKGRKRLFQDFDSPTTTGRFKKKHSYQGTILDVIAKDTGVTRTDSAIQEIVVHELCHAADSKTDNKNDRKELRKNYLKNHGKFAVGQWAIGNAIYLGTLFTEAPNSLGVAALIGSYATYSLPAYKRRRDTYKEYIRVGRPTEAKAYALEEHATSFPKVISFLDRN